MFVLGCQRSGTTLLGQIIGAHPDAVLIDEKNGAYDLVDALLNDSGETDDILQGCAASARKMYREQDRFSSDGGLAPAVSHIVLKVPNATYHLERFRKGYRAHWHFVFAVRGVYDVVCSMKNLARIPMVENQIKLIQKDPGPSSQFSEEVRQMAAPQTPDHVRRALMWRIKTGFSAAFQADPLSALVIRYEDLVSDPKKWTYRVLDHCGMSDKTAAHESVFQGSGPGGTDRTRAIDEQSLGRWSGQLTESERLDIGALTGDLMGELYLG